MVFPAHSPLRAQVPRIGDLPKETGDQGIKVGLAGSEVRLSNKKLAEWDDWNIVKLFEVEKMMIS